jgi:hypothetical protein
MIRRRITFPDGTQAEIIREVRSRGGRILELAYRRLPEGAEQRVYFGHGWQGSECSEGGRRPE